MELALLYDMICTQPVYYEFEHIAVPTFLLIGDKDNTAIGKDLAPPSVRAQLGHYPELAKQAVARIPGAKLVEFPDMGHAPQIQSSVIPVDVCRKPNFTFSVPAIERE